MPVTKTQIANSIFGKTLFVTAFAQLLVLTAFGSAMAQQTLTPEQRRDSTLAAVVRGCAAEVSASVRVARQYGDGMFPIRPFNEERAVEHVLRTVAGLYANPIPQSQAAIQRELNESGAWRSAQNAEVLAVGGLLRLCVQQQRERIERDPASVMARGARRMDQAPLITGGFEPGRHYRLSTAFRGPGFSLDIHNGGVRDNMAHLAPTGNYSGQYWSISPVQDGWLRLRTQFRGEQMCLDVYNGSERNFMPHLAPCAQASGQYWKIVSTGGGQYRIQNMFGGKGRCLDIFNGGAFDNGPHLTDCAGYSGQDWRIESIQ